MRETKLADANGKTELRILEHGGYVYFEMVTTHDGTRVASSMRVDRDIAVPTIRRVFP